MPNDWFDIEMGEDIYKTFVNRKEYILQIEEIRLVSAPNLQGFNEEAISKIED